MKKKLTRKTGDKALVAGVLAGLAEYFDQDVVLFRLLAVAGIILTGLFPGVLLYIVAWIIMPIDSGVDYEVVE